MINAPPRQVFSADTHRLPASHTPPNSTARPHPLPSRDGNATPPVPPQHPTGPASSPSPHHTARLPSHRYTLTTSESHRSPSVMEVLNAPCPLYSHSLLHPHRTTTPSQTSIAPHLPPQVPHAPSPITSLRLPPHAYYSHHPHGFHHTPMPIPPRLRTGGHKVHQPSRL